MDSAIPPSDPLKPSGTPDSETKEVSEEPKAETNPSENILSRVHYTLLWISFWPTIAMLLIFFVATIAGIEASIATKAVMQIGVVVLLLRLGQMAWRFLKGGKFRAGVIVGALGWFYGPVYGVALIVLLLLGAVECSDLDSDRLVEKIQQTQATLDSHPVITNPENGESFKRLSDDGSAFRFNDCFDELYTSHNAGSKIEGVIRRMHNVSLRTAEALTYDVIVDVCLAHAKAPKADLGPYLGRSLRNAQINEWKEKREFDACQVDLISNSQRAQSSNGLIDLRRAMCALSPELETIITLKAEGYSNRKIGAKLGISESLVGNKVSKARNQLAVSLGIKRGQLR